MRARITQYGPPTTFQEYLELVGSPKLVPSPTTAQRHAKGIYITVPVTLVGLKNVTTRVVYSLFRASDMAPLQNWIYQSENQITATSENYTTLLSMWIQSPGNPGTYVAVIELIDPDAQSLADVRTKPFNVSGSSTPVTAGVTVSIAPLARVSPKSLRFEINVTNKVDVPLTGVRITDKRFPQCNKAVGTLASR